MATQSNDGLTQHIWKLTEIGSIEAPQLITPEFNITLQFDEESRVHGASACNRYTSMYKIHGPYLHFQPIASTRMMCPEPAMALESDYLAALGQVETHKLQEDQLALYYDQGKGQLLFRIQVTAA